MSSRRLLSLHPNHVLTQVLNYFNCDSCSRLDLLLLLPSSHPPVTRLSFAVCVSEWISFVQRVLCLCVCPFLILHNLHTETPDAEEGGMRLLLSASFVSC